ncbi:M28 family peptidase [Microbulbifer agarilyticus]
MIILSEQPVVKSIGYHPFPPSTEEAWSYVEDVIEITRKHAEHRRAGTPGDQETRAYIAKRLREFGLQDVKEDSQTFTKRSYTEWHFEVGGTEIPSFPLRSSAFTPAEGIEADILYVDGMLSDDMNVAGKIVMMPINVTKTTYEAIAKGLADYVYDPKENLAKRDSCYLISVADNYPGAYYMAAKMGAVGFIGILPFETGTADFYPDSSMIVRPEIPALYIGKYNGEAIKERFEKQQIITARMDLRGTLDEFASTANVMGVLPGLTDDVVMVTTHHDTGWEGGVQDASGVATVLAVARYFADQPGDIYREKTLVFNFGANHFGWDYPASNTIFKDHNPELFNNLKAVIGVEHIAKEVRVENREYVPTGRVEPHVIWAPRSPMLRKWAQEAIERHDLADSLMIRPGSMALIGEAKKYYFSGIPAYQIISAPPYLYDSVDTIEMVAKDRLAPVANTVVDIVEQLTNLIPGNWIE